MGTAKYWNLCTYSRGGKNWVPGCPFSWTFSVSKKFMTLKVILSQQAPSYSSQSVIKHDFIQGYLNLSCFPHQGKGDDVWGSST